MCHLRDIDESVYYPRPLYLRMGCPLELAIRMGFIKKNLDCAHIRLQIFTNLKCAWGKIRMVNSSRMSEGECPTCQKVFFMAEKYRISYGSWMSKLKRLYSFKTTISVVVLNQMESCKRIKENTFDETASNILLAFIIVF